MKLALIPQPKQLTMGNGRLTLPANGTVGISDARLLAAADAARPLFRQCSVGIAVPGVSDTIAIAIGDGLKPGGYRLKIDADGVRLDAESEAAAFHSVQTLLQIAKHSPAGKLPHLGIDDWPDIQDRGIYYDIARGRVPKLERLIQQADVLSQYKINQFQLYIEHTFRFRRHPDIGRDASPLTAEDILRLDAHCRERHVELVPSLSSFGHLAPVLNLPRYRHLAENWTESAAHEPGWSAWTLAPGKEETYVFLDDLFAEFLPCFSSDRFNVCCDEVGDLGSGQSRELAEKIGKGRLYLRHIVRLRDLAAKYGKRIMFWGDIIRHYPELIKEIPKDVTVLDWGYYHTQNFAAIRDFRDAGLPFFACPGTNSWNALFPRTVEAKENIHGFAAAASANGGQGLLCTDWGDGGHYNFMELSWPGYLFAAEQGWNTEADAASFDERFCRLFLGSTTTDLPKALTTLGGINSLFRDWNTSIWMYLFFARPDNELFTVGEADGWTGQNGRMEKTVLRLNAAFGRNIIKKLAIVRKVLVKHAARKNEDAAGVLPCWIFAVDTITHAARKLAAFGPGGKDTPAAHKALKREMTALMKRFEKLWMARNRRSEIHCALERYRAAIGAL